MSEERIKLKVVSDGTEDGTKVVDQDGKRLDNVTDFTFTIGAEQLATVTLTLVGIPVNINYAAQVTSLAELEAQQFEQSTAVVTVDNI
jgi:hypothetical protein